VPARASGPPTGGRARASTVHRRAHSPRYDFNGDELAIVPVGVTVPEQPPPAGRSGTTGLTPT